MVFLNAAMEKFGRSSQSGEEMGEHLICCGVIKTFQKMWRYHFNDDLFNVDKENQILLRNLLVSLQVNATHLLLTVVVVVTIDWMLWVAAVTVCKATTGVGTFRKVGRLDALPFPNRNRPLDKCY